MPSPFCAWSYLHQTRSVNEVLDSINILAQALTDLACLGGVVDAEAARALFSHSTPELRVGVCA